MKTTHSFFTILFCLIGIFTLYSCGSLFKDSESDSASNETEMSYQQALQEQVSDLKDYNSTAAQRWKEDEEERLEQEKYYWMDGEWYLSFTVNDPYVGSLHYNVTMKINTSDKSIVVIDKSDSGVDYSGTYTINESQNIISYSDIYVAFDPDRQLFYETAPDEWGFNKRYYYHKN